MANENKTNLLSIIVTVFLIVFIAYVGYVQSQIRYVQDNRTNIAVLQNQIEQLVKDTGIIKTDVKKLLEK